MSDAETGSEGSEEDRGRDSPSIILLCSDGGSSLNRFFEALADNRRRRILIYLQQNKTVSLQDLTEFLANQEEIGPNSEDYKRIQVDLVHLHLPKLTDHGLLAFDERTNMVSQESLPTAVEQILDLASNLEKTDYSDHSCE